ncbi:MAG: AbrB family transcriptional regulator [Spirochaetae bacterium HGW-Spirochaetae-1]|jgi:AbrB family looped-hinge helix DNA binding protein|nr:MAG: AbrB family transcriptional regulator [Spirochaetae bacterium HGW-Spirochaetae-1]
MTHSKITSKGQITIPRLVRNKLNLKTGDKIDFKIRDGEITLVPISKETTEVFGVLSRDNQKAVTIDQMNESIKERLRKSHT